MKGLHGATYNKALLIKSIGQLLATPTSDMARGHSKLSADEKKNRYQMAIVLSKLRRAARESAESDTAPPNTDSTAAASAATQPVGYDRNHLMFTSLPTWITREEAKVAAAAAAAPPDEDPDEGPASPTRRSTRICRASPVNPLVAARALALRTKLH